MFTAYCNLFSIYHHSNLVKTILIYYIYLSICFVSLIVIIKYIMLTITCCFNKHISLKKYKL